ACQLDGRLLPERQHVGNRGAVLAPQLVDQRQALLERLARARVEVNLVPQVRRVARQLLRLGGEAVRSVDERAEAGVVRGCRLQRADGEPQRVERTGIVTQRAGGIGGRRRDRLRVRGRAQRLLDLGLLVGSQLCRGDLVCLVTQQLGAAGK